MKKLLLGALCIVVMSAAGFGGYTYYENQKQEQMDPWLKANLAALADLEKPIQGEGGMECKYIINEGKCEISVGVNGKIKVFGIGVLHAGADGKISFDGKASCTADGNSSCIHVTCKELYEVIF